MFSLDWIDQFFFLFPYEVEIFLGKLHGFHADKWSLDKSCSVFWSGQRAGLHWVITSSQRGVRGRKRSPAERGLRGAVEERSGLGPPAGEPSSWSVPNVSDQLCHCPSSLLSFLPSQERIGLPPHFSELRLAVAPFYFNFFGVVIYLPLFCTRAVQLIACDYHVHLGSNAGFLISSKSPSPAFRWSGS